MQLIASIKEKMSKDGISALKISKMTGIPAYRIYKWLDGKAKPKAEDSKLLEQWLKDCLEEVPTNGNKKATEPVADEINQGLKREIKLLQDHNQTLKDIILTNLTAIQSSLGMNYQLLESIHVQQTTDDQVIFRHLEKMRNLKAGSISAEADKLELDVEVKRRQKGKIQHESRHGKQQS